MWNPLSLNGDIDNIGFRAFKDTMWTEYLCKLLISTCTVIWGLGSLRGHAVGHHATLRNTGYDGAVFFIWSQLPLFHDKMGFAFCSVDIIPWWNDGCV